MRLDLPTHTITYTNGVNYKIPIYWELWRNGQLIKTVFGTVGGMYNDIAQENYNNHPDGSSIEAEVGLSYSYSFKFWHLGKINLPIMLIMFAADSPNTNNRSGMYNGDKAFSVQMGEFKQFDFLLVNNPLGWAKINCNAGFILADGSFSFNIPAPITLEDIVGGTDGVIIPKLATRLRDNILIEWYNISTGVATGARLPNNRQIAGINNPFYILPSVVPPPTNLYYHFNAADYFDVTRNPTVRSPISFHYGNTALSVATLETQLMRKRANELELCVPPNDAPYLYKSNNGGNNQVIEGYLFSKNTGISSYCIIFKNPLNSKAGCRIKAQKHTLWNRNGKITIKSNAFEGNVEHTITNDLLQIVDFHSSAAVEKIYVFVEQTASSTFLPFMGLNISAEFYCENNGEISEPYLYKEDAKLFLGDDVVDTTLFETITTTTNYTDLTTIPDNLWQPTDIVQIPSAGVYYVYGRFTLENGERKVAKIRSFTQS